MADDLPQAGAQIVLEGVTEFMNNLQSVTTGLGKIVQGFVALSAGANTTASEIDSATGKIISGITKMGTAEGETVDKMVSGNSAIARSANQMASDLEAAMSRGAAALSKFMFSGGGGSQLQELLGKIGSAGSSASSGAGALPGGGIPQAGQAEQRVADAVKKAVQEEEQALAGLTKFIEQDTATKTRLAAIEEANYKRITEALNQSVNQRIQLLQRDQDAEEAALARITQEQNAASNARVEALQRQMTAEEQASQVTTGGSLNFVRAITGMVAANNLLNIGALNTAFNIGTLAASFDRMGTKGLLLGGALGVALAAIASLVQAFNSVVSGAQAVIGAVEQVTAQVVDFGIKTGEAALKGAADYQKAMAFYVALTGATREQLDQLNNKIVEVAQTTLFSMPKAAEAVNELARAGATGTQIISQGALDAVVALSTAAAGELGLADAAKTVTGTVGAFTKVLKDGSPQIISYTDAVDAITQAAQLSRLSFTEVTQAFRQAAPVANSANISITDLAATIAILGNASETGTLSGTALKQMILDLEHPSTNAAKTLDALKISLFDGAGALRPFRDVIIDLNTKLGEHAIATGQATEQTRLKALADIFGARAALAANIITNQGVEAFDKMEAAMKNVTAVDMANVMLLPLDARMTLLQNSVQALAITFAGPFVSALSDAVNAGINFVHNGLPVGAIELAGQAIVAVATNQGFGALQAKLIEMSDPKLLGFFTSLIGFGSSVRAAIVDIIVPALQSVIDRMVDFASQQSTIDAWSSALDNAGTIVLGVAGAVAGAIGVIADFVDWLNENRGVLIVLEDAAIGFAAVLGGVFLASVIAVAVPIGIVIAAMAILGQSIRTPIEVMGQFAGAIIDLVATPSTEAANVVVDAGATMAEGAVEGATGVVDAFGVIVDASAAMAGDTVTNTEDMVTGVIDADNVMVAGTADGWDEMGSVTAEGVQSMADDMAGLDPVITALANAPGQAAPSWAAGLNSVLETLHSFVTAAWNMVKDFLSSLASNPLFEGIAGFAGGPVGLAAVISFKAVTTAITTIGDAASGVTAKVHSIADSVHPVIANFQNMEGRLRSSLDNISASAQAARDRLTQVGTPGESTAPGDYPVKPGGGGGGGRGGKGGAGPEGAYNKALDEAAKFAQDLSTTIQNAGADAIAKLEDVARKAAEASTIATREYFEKIGKIDDDYIKGVVDRGATLQQSRQDREQKQLFDDEQKKVAQRRGDARRQRDEDLSDFREGQDNYQKRVQDILDKQFQYAQADKATKRAQDRADEDTAFKRKLDDEEARLRHIEDLQNKHGTRQTAADITKIQQQGGFSKAEDDPYTLEKKRLARQRTQEDLNTARDRERAREDEVWNREEAQLAENRKLGIEDAALQLRHQRTAEDRAQRKADEVSDTQFSKDQAQAKQDNEDKLADADLAKKNELARQKDINDKAIAAREFQEKLALIQQHAAEEGQTIIGGLEKTLRGVQDKIDAKVPEILKSGGEAMQPIMDEIVANLTEQMNTVFDAASNARAELDLVLTPTGDGSGGVVVDSMATATTDFINASIQFTNAMIAAAANIAAAAGGSPAVTTTPLVGVGAGIANAAAAAVNSGAIKSPLQTSDPSNGAGNGPGSGTFGNGPGGGGTGGEGSGSGGGSQGGGGADGGGSAAMSAPMVSSLESSSVVVPSTSNASVVNNTSYNVSASYANQQSPASITMDLGALTAISRR